MFTGIFLIFLIFFGLLLTYAFRLKLYFEERLAVGLLLSFIVLGYGVLYISYIFGLNWVSLAIFTALTLFVSSFVISERILLVLRNELKEFLTRLKQKNWIIFYCLLLIFITVFGYQLSKLLDFEDGRFFTQPLHAWGDISQHLEIISGFAYGDNFPPQNHSLSGTKISYPFMIDFITSIFVNPFGLGFDQAVKLTGVVMMSILIVILSYLILGITKSKTAAILVILLFLFNGGFGFIHFFTDLTTSNKSLLDFILHLEKDYTALKDLGFWWINVMLSMFIPQRSFLFGLPVSLLILKFLIELSKQFDLRKFILAVLLFALLPVIHAYSLIGLLPFVIFYGLIIFFKNLKSIKYIIPIILMGISISAFIGFSFLEQSSDPKSVFSLNFWWMANDENPFTFYIKNFGIILFVLPLFLLLGIRKRSELFYIGLIGLIWLVLPSIFSFTPWEFDTIKVLIYWYLASVLFLSYILGNWLRSDKLIINILAVIIIFHFIFSGLLDNFRLLLSSGTKYETYSPQAIELGDFARNNTKNSAVFLSIDKFDNPALTLAGRSVVLGFRGWLWTHGINYSQREADVKQMLSGQGDIELFNKYNISHILLFNEQSNDFKVDQNYFDLNFKLIYDKNGYRMYEL